MPTIIVQSNDDVEQPTNVLLYEDVQPGGIAQGTNVLLHEDVQPEHLASGHHAAQLIERLGWAVSDAKDAEDSEAPRRD